MQRIPSIALALATALTAVSFAGAAEAKDRGGHHWHGGHHHGHHGHHYGWGGVGVNLIDPGYDDNYYTSYYDDDDLDD